jgi:hypothetical protein
MCSSTSGLPRVREGAGASVPRSRRRCRPQARRLNPAVFSFGFGGLGKLLLLRLALGRRWRSRPDKSGGPPLFEPSLKVQRNVAHNPPADSRSCPGATASTRAARKRSITLPGFDPGIPPAAAS